MGMRAQMRITAAVSGRCALAVPRSAGTAPGSGARRGGGGKHPRGVSHQRAARDAARAKDVVARALGAHEVAVRGAPPRQLAAALLRPLMPPRASRARLPSQVDAGRCAGAQGAAVASPEQRAAVQEPEPAAWRSRAGPRAAVRPESGTGVRRGMFPLRISRASEKSSQVSEVELLIREEKDIYRRHTASRGVHSHYLCTLRRKSLRCSRILELFAADSRAMRACDLSNACCSSVSLRLA